MARRRHLALALAFTGLLSLGGVQPVQAGVAVKAVKSATAAYGYAFKPAKVSVGTGTTVTWKAVAGKHTVTATSRNWGKDDGFSTTRSTSFTFKKAGTYTYRCIYHSIYNPTTKKCTGMCGKVVVG